MLAYAGMNSPKVITNINKSQTIRGWNMYLGSHDTGRELFFQLDYIGYRLALLLVDLGNHDNLNTLQQCCLNYLRRHLCKDRVPEELRDILPHHLVNRLEVAILSQHHVGAWAGDRLIITGPFSYYSPLPPDGKWKTGSEGELYHLAKIFQYNHFLEVSKCNHYDNKIFHRPVVVANLDKKEYLDPKAYPAKETTLLDIITTRNINGVMAGLFLKLIRIISLYELHGWKSFGTWVGDRIIICPLESLENMDTYFDTSNPEDVLLWKQ